MTAKEILDKCQRPYTSSIQMEDIWVNEKAALEAMREYYSQAIDDAVESAEIEELDEHYQISPHVNTELMLKLKK